MFVRSAPVHGSQAPPQSVSVVKFQAPHCRTCRATSPLLDRVAKQYPQARFFSLDLIRNGKAAGERMNAFFKEHGVRSMPYVEIFVGSQRVETETVPPSALERFEMQMGAAVARLRAASTKRGVSRQLVLLRQLLRAEREEVVAGAGKGDAPAAYSSFTSTPGRLRRGAPMQPPPALRGPSRRKSSPVRGATGGRRKGWRTPKMRMALTPATEEAAEAAKEAEEVEAAEGLGKSAPHAVQARAVQTIKERLGADQANQANQANRANQALGGCHLRPSQAVSGLLRPPLLSPSKAFSGRRGVLLAAAATAAAGSVVAGPSSAIAAPALASLAGVRPPAIVCIVSGFTLAASQYESYAAAVASLGLEPLLYNDGSTNMSPTALVDGAADLLGRADEAVRRLALPAHTPLVLVGIADLERTYQPWAVCDPHAHQPLMLTSPEPHVALIVLISPEPHVTLIVLTSPEPHVTLIVLTSPGLDMIAIW